MSPDNACASMLLCSLGKQLFFRVFFLYGWKKKFFSTVDNQDNVRILLRLS